MSLAKLARGTLLTVGALVYVDGVSAQSRLLSWFNAGLPDNRYSEQARQGIRAGFEMQAQAGLELDQTVWNYHFETGTDRLRPGGRALLDRLARRGPNLSLRLQQARDLPYVLGDHTKLDRLRIDLDARRLKTIDDYLAFSQPHVMLSIRVSDPNAVGMSGIEAVKAYRELQQTGRGILPSELQQGLGSVLRSSLGEGGAGSPGGMPPPAPISAGASGTPAPFGADATAPPPPPALPPDAGIPPPPVEPPPPESPPP